LAYFSPETKQNKWYYELMTIRQTAEETVDQYARRFTKLLRKVNTTNLVPAVMQVRMFLYGLNLLLTPLVSTDNPANLNRAIERARVVETGYNYVPTKQISLNVPTAITETAPLPIPTTTTKPTEAPVSDIDALTQQMQQLTLNYTNLSSVLLAQGRPPRNSGAGLRFNGPRNNNNNTNNRNPNITCYHYGNQGYISHNCQLNNRSNGQNSNNNNGNNGNNRPRQRTGAVNYLNFEEDYEYDYESEEE
jgi:hypothetical protein